MELDIPYTSTGPAIVNIFAPTPIIYPSDLYSIAGEMIEFANPVIGTRDPAPANLPILLNTFIEVRKALIKISDIDTIVPARVSDAPLKMQYSNIISPYRTNKTSN